jgi:hypothetical protein
MMVVLLFTGASAFLIRSVLIVTGLHKDPILRSFEKYGGQENFYYPLVQLIVALLIFSFSVGIVLFRDWVIGSMSSFGIYVLAALLIYGAINAHRWLMHYAQQHPRWFLLYPHWYTDLRERTTRVERRRLAYMWLRLPWRARTMYNSSEPAFTIWVDLVLLATLRSEDDTPANDWRIYTSHY